MITLNLLRSRVHRASTVSYRIHYRGHYRSCDSVLTHRDYTRMSNTSTWPEMATSPVMVGVCQMTCSADKNNNFDTAKGLVHQCKHLGAQMVFLPEACDYIATSKEESMCMAESLDGDIITRYRQLARDQGVWLSLGGVHIQTWQ